MKTRRPLNVRSLIDNSSDTSLRSRFPAASPILSGSALVTASDEKVVEDHAIFEPEPLVDCRPAVPHYG